MPNRRLLATIVAAVLPLTVVNAAGAETAPSGERDDDHIRSGATTDVSTSARHVRLGGVRVRVNKRTRQVVTVNHRKGYRARVTFWRKRDRWKRVRTTRHGRIGYGGLVRGKKRRQGTGTTPLGTYRMPRAFGNNRKPKRAKLPFHRVHSGDYWVQDNKSRFYNRRRHKSQGGFRWWLPTSNYNSSERLRDYGQQYAWSVVIAYNRPNPVRHRGSGIFLHVNGDGATAGCVSAPRKFIRSTVARLRPGFKPVIAIGR